MNIIVSEMIILITTAFNVSALKNISAANTENDIICIGSFIQCTRRQVMAVPMKTYKYVTRQ